MTKKAVKEKKVKKEESPKIPIEVGNTEALKVRLLDTIASHLGRIADALEGANK